MKIAVAGTGYVGLSIATLLAQHNEVVAVDVIPEKVEKINRNVSPIQDEYLEKYLAEKPLDLKATLDIDLTNADLHLMGKYILRLVYVHVFIMELNDRLCNNPMCVFYNRVESSREKSIETYC